MHGLQGFRSWLEDLNRRDDPNATAEYIPASFQKTPEYKLSRHAWNTTPGGQGTSKTISDRPHSWEADDATLIQKISLLISPPDPKDYPKYAGRPGLDGVLPNRRKDGKALVTSQGTPGYMSPEEAEKTFKTTYEHDADSVETLLDRCADLFVWLDKPCKQVAKLWLKFRSFLHMNESVKPHVVNYQTNIMRLKDCDKIFPQVDDLVQTSQDSDRYAELIAAWNKFYGAWEKLAPTLRHYLTTFEKNTARR